MSATSRTSGTDASASAVTERSFFLDAEPAELLKKYPLSPEGFRYDKRNKRYVEMEDGSMVMVHKGQDGLRQTNSREASPTGNWVKYLPDKQKWRELTPAEMTAKRPHPEADLAFNQEDATAGPSKRARLTNEATKQALVQRLLSTPPSALDSSLRQWENWGKTTRPESDESIEIGGKHYSIVAQERSSEPNLVYLQHPEFKPGRFDAFEHMLRVDPSRQPKWALKQEGQWRVRDNHPPFEMPMTQYVSSAFNLFSDHSAQAIARTVFDRSSLPGGIDSEGLSTLALTFHHWKHRASPDLPPPELFDPLLLLPTLPRRSSTGSNSHDLALPPQFDVALHRIDFDTDRVNAQFNNELNRPDSSVRAVFSNILEHSGYTVDRTSRMFAEDALIFKREGLDVVFVLKLPSAPVEGTLKRWVEPGAEQALSALRSRVADTSTTTSHTTDWSLMLQNGKTIHLVGGIEMTPANQKVPFIVREG
ncbi:hypothetical protein ICA16_27280 [Pseudomonas anatoliensis]|uniref:hypothetical protein n=1 Tax=Pseudomonas anatoliensis TaxID=2710589 RepID=UPI001B331A0C|nr:hypothetical protein [Pseudomonas anatoliensis]MBP5959385.1 hypothetical protein [Pseudomonas anatoliensis]